VLVSDVPVRCPVGDAKSDKIGAVFDFGNRKAKARQRGLACAQRWWVGFQNNRVASHQPKSFCGDDLKGVVGVDEGDGGGHFHDQLDGSRPMEDGDSLGFGVE
jgi:hypothetical protein